MTPDPFQSEALDALDSERSVLVMAPTGSGKTLIADYAIARALAAGKDAVYTTPLKALSNQKLRDLAARHGADNVGLITGDRVVNPEAPVLVMTTEVLRAMLYDRALESRRALGVIVLDEFHYLQDEERGSAWEEIVINAPKQAALVCLSATIPDASLVHRWLDEVHGSTTLVVADRRPVELQHLYAIGNLRSSPILLLPMYIDGQLNQVAERFDGNRPQVRGEGRRQRDRGRAVTPERADLLAHLDGENLLPALWFVFSRAGCDSAVERLAEDGVRLTDEHEAFEIRALVSEALAPLDAGVLRAIDARAWQRSLEDGIASHHGGLAPVQREVVEAAFARGLVKVVFATETLALGVNLPARTAIIDRVTRGGGEVISAADFAQLAGRAGRRGIDSVGQVVVPWSPQISFQRIADLAGGRLESVRSAFKISAAVAANLVRLAPDFSAARASVESSLRHRLTSAQEELLRTDLRARRTELSELDVAELELAESTAAGSTAAESGSAEPVGRTEQAGQAAPVSIDQALADVTPGDVLVDASRPGGGPMLALVISRKRGRPTVEAIRLDGRKVHLTPQSMRAVPLTVGRIELPEWSRTKRGLALDATEALQAFEVPPLPEPTKAPGKTSVNAFGKRRSNGARSRLETTIAELTLAIDGTNGAVGRELESVLRLLERRGHVRDWRLEPSGQVVRRLFHPAGLQLAECLTDGIFDDLDPASLASATSWFTVRTRLGGPASTGFATTALTDIFSAVRQKASSVFADELAEGISPSPHPEPALGVPVYKWASGAPLDEALAGTDVLVGDLIREIRQVAELLEQILTVPGRHRASAEAAIEALRRGPVLDT